jgi:hypothetical protein
MSADQASVHFDESDWDYVDPIYGGPFQRDVDRRTFDIPHAAIACSSCHSGRRITCEIFDSYFSPEGLKCRSCQADIDLFKNLTSIHRTTEVIR